ncbi:hypothetical protein MCHI_001533 [Candidatus Magnetoovum chiemensis]|nr:hypothetical protein MCHI_001533 [Candidatus Magnetoovum chiemensis]
MLFCHTKPPVNSVYGFNSMFCALTLTKPFLKKNIVESALSL